MQVIADIKFLDRLQSYDKENVPEPILKKVKPIVTANDFDPAVIFNQNRAASTMAKWCIAIRKYAEALKVVRPK